MAITVRTEQIYLQRLGLYCDLIDGKAGDKTRAARKAVQKKAGLKQTGDKSSKYEKALKQLYAKRNKTMLSKHFKKSEFKCGCRGKYCNGYPKTVSPKLIGILEKLRVTYGKPITITSGLRCNKYNSSLVGSVPNSAHKSGKAADIYIPGASLSGIRSKAYAYGAAYSYYGTSNMGNAVHINV